MTTGLITKDGKKIFLDRNYNDIPTREEVTKFKVGIGNTTPSTSDTDLIHAVPITGTELVDSCDVTTNWADSADCTLSVNSTTYKEGVGSLNLTKDAGASSTCYSSKTTSSLDFTDKELSIWVYIIDATMLAKLQSAIALFIYYGSDSSNYYYWNKASSTLSVGWNLIDGLTSSNATGTNGSPTITGCDYTRVGVNSLASATTWSDLDLMFDDIKLVSSDDLIIGFETGYPVLDYTNLQADIRCRLATTYANGYLITEFGVFNEDGTPLMESRDVFNGISKSSTDEIIFIAKTTVD